MNIREAAEALEGLIGKYPVDERETEALTIAVTGLHDRRLLTCAWCAYLQVDDGQDSVSSTEGTCRLTGARRELKRDGCPNHTRIGHILDTDDVEQKGLTQN